MDASTLREHAIHLLGNAREEHLMRIVRLLEEQGGTCDRSDSVISSEMPHGMSQSESTNQRTNPLSLDEGVLPVAVMSEAVRFDEEGDDGTSPMIDAGVPDASVRGKRRSAVSAVPVALTKVRSFEPRVIKKTEEKEEAIKVALEQCPLFSNLGPEDTMIVVNALEEVELPAAQDIITQGQPPVEPKFFILIDGLCEILKSGKQVASVKPGGTFGELEMMHSVSEYAATIRTVKASVLYALDREHYQNIVLNVSLKKREQYRNLLNGVGFLEDVAEYEKMTLSEALSQATFAPGDAIIKFGTRTQYMHIIIEGTVQVVGRELGKKVDVIQLGPLNPVGELEFLFGHLAIADVIAITPVVTAKISKKHFEGCIGPITDTLKQYVAQKGNYTYFMHTEHTEASVKDELTKLGKQAAKKVASGAEGLSNVNENGEVILVDPQHDGKDDHKLVLHRFPLAPLQQGNLVMIGIKEDKTITLWNNTCEDVTGFIEAEVVGTPLSAFMYDDSSREMFHQTLIESKHWVGSSEKFCAEYLEKSKKTYVFSRKDGLSNAQMQLSVVPPAFLHKSVSEVFLVVGIEIRKEAPVTTTDNAAWLTNQVIAHLQTPGLSCEECLGRIEEDAKKYGELKDAKVSSAQLRPVDIRKMVEGVVMQHAPAAASRAQQIPPRDYSELPCAMMFCDSTLLPNCINFAFGNAVTHSQIGGVVSILIKVVELLGSEFIEFSITDDGPGFAKKKLDQFYNVPLVGPLNGLQKVKMALSDQGGRMLIETVPGDTRVKFQIPLIPVEDETGASVEQLVPSLSMSSTSKGSFMKRRNYTTMVVEDTAVHRNTLCSMLWDRKHAVLPGNRWVDVQKLKESTDILVVDPTQTVLSELRTTGGDPFKYLRDRERDAAIIITGSNIDDRTIEAYNKAGFFTLQKPFTVAQVVAVLRKAEERVCIIKADEDKIKTTREMFSKTNRSKWEKGRKLGAGSFGEVYEALDTITGGRMAVKIMKVPHDTSNAAAVLEEKQLEIQAMCSLQHKNIIHYFYCDYDPEQLTVSVFMEFAQGGTLKQLINEKGKLEMSEYVRLLRDIVEGVQYIHSQRYVHCDLKTENVLLSHDGVGKIGDFGTAKRLDEGQLLYGYQGTIMYMSPECMNADAADEGGEAVGYGMPSDVWSIGCIAMEMATNKPPFSHISGLALVKYISGLKEDPDLSHLFGQPPEVFEFIRACLQIDPQKRPAASQLLQMSIFREGDDETVKTALKELEKAQFFHILSQFVAFQDEEEIEAQRKQKEESKLPTNFFDSDSDGGEGKFFEDSEDEDEEKEEGDEEEGERGGKDKGKAETDKLEIDSPEKTPSSKQPSSHSPTTAPPSQLFAPHPPMAPNGGARPPRPHSTSPPPVDPRDVIALHSSLYNLLKELETRHLLQGNLPHRDPLAGQYDALLSEEGSEEPTAFSPDVARLVKDDLRLIRSLLQEKGM